MENSGKQYGLLVPKKAAQNLQPRPSIFGDDSESDSGEGSRIGNSFKNESVQKRQTKLDIQKALEQDPTVYQYDEVYDEMEEKKIEQKRKQKDPEKKPKYIQSLLATAERRKREHERRTERKVQKEREAEGEEFKDKESFVTSAYRKKLEEFQKMDEQERLQDKIEELTDVAKQKDLGGFYRHLFRQTVGDDEGSGEIKVKEEKDIESEHKEGEEQKDSKEGIQGDSPEASGLKSTGKAEERSYRKRKMSSSSESDGGKDDAEKKTKAVKGSDGDTDSSSSGSSSDSSSGSSSSSSEDEDDEAKEKKETVKDTVGKEAKESDETGESSKKTSDSKSENVNGITEGKESDKVDDSSHEVKIEKLPEEPKPNIWEKKTVGPAFDAALQRYLLRKSARMAKT